ncbi:unnamed protein product [Leuciscus chuanchicus]
MPFVPVKPWTGLVSGYRRTQSNRWQKRCRWAGIAFVLVSWIPSSRIVAQRRSKGVNSDNLHYIESVVSDGTSLLPLETGGCGLQFVNGDSDWSSYINSSCYKN